MLQLKGVSKIFDTKAIMASVDIRINKGGMLCLSGPSGIGKSTVLNIAAGLISPDTGEVNRASRRLGVASQNPVLLPWKSAFDNLRFILSSQKERDESKIYTWLYKMGLKEAAHKKPHEMSGGMQKRLGLAASLVTEPELLFLDEPFTSLDHSWQQRIALELKQLNIDSGLTIFMASHELSPVKLMGAKIIRISDTPIRIRQSP
jgi:ABC-type nitrate/sulfonate/bicarbonate transport system ATPase subunit